MSNSNNWRRSIRKQSVDLVFITVEGKITLLIARKLPKARNQKAICNQFFI